MMITVTPWVPFYQALYQTKLNFVNIYNKSRISWMDLSIAETISPSSKKQAQQSKMQTAWFRIWTPTNKSKR